MITIDTAPFAALAGTGRALAPEEAAALARRAGELLDVDALVPEGRGDFALLWRDDWSEAWLNTWWEARDTGFHDHDGSCVGVYVVRGRASNELLPYGGPRAPRWYGEGESFSAPGTGIHRMDHAAGAITVHVYSPPIRRIGAYDVRDGQLHRWSGSPDEASPESPALLALLDRDAAPAAAG